jgi:hypothetical protein
MGPTGSSSGANRVKLALITVVADSYLTRVSTRRMDKLVKTPGINGLSSIHDAARHPGITRPRRATRTPRGDNLKGTERGPDVPLFIIEREYAARVAPYLGAFDEINEINATEGVRWLYSFLSLDHRKTFCLYEAPTAEMILSAAAAAGIPADRVTEVVGRVLPSGALEPVD